MKNVETCHLFSFVFFFLARLCVPNTYGLETLNKYTQTLKGSYGYERNCFTEYFVPPGRVGGLKLKSKCIRLEFKIRPLAACFLTDILIVMVTCDLLLSLEITWIL